MKVYQLIATVHNSGAGFKYPHDVYDQEVHLSRVDAEKAKEKFIESLDYLNGIRIHTLEVPLRG